MQRILARALFGSWVMFTIAVLSAAVASHNTKYWLWEWQTESREAGMRRERTFVVRSERGRLGLAMWHESILLSSNRVELSEQMDRSRRRLAIPFARCLYGELTPGASTLHRWASNAGFGFDGASFSQPLVQGSMRVVVIPYWFLCVLTLLPVLRLSQVYARRWRRLKRGLCIECGYDLRASHDRCPECGAPLPEGA